MSKQKSPYEISHKYEIMPLMKESAYPIPTSDWEYLKEKISRIKSTVPIFHTIGSILLGVAATAALSALALPAAITQVEYSIIGVFWAIFAVTLISGILCFCFTFQQRKGVASCKDDVLEEMARLEKRFTVHMSVDAYISSGSKKQAKTLIFSDDFLDHRHWSQNHWGSNCCSFSDAQMCFTGPVTGPAVRKGEDGSHRDLINKLELGHTYEVICYVKTTPGTTAQFRLWCHDKIRSGISRGTNKSTNFRTPGPRREFVSLPFTPNHNPDIRIHLQYKPGKGTIYVDNVRIYEIS